MYIICRLTQYSIVSSNVTVNSRALRNSLYFNSEFILASIVIVSSNVIVDSRALLS